jgi:hypothetical protein
MQLHATIYNLQLYFIIFYNYSPSLKIYDYFCDYGATIKLHIFPYWLAFWNFHPTIGFYVHLVAKLFIIWLLIMVCLYI